VEALRYNAAFLTYKKGGILEQDTNERKTPEPQDDIPFWRVVLSVVQASFGVQNRNNRERDFKQGRVLPFVVAALLFTTLFVLALMLVVKLVLTAG
jgi:hypothetical protein